MRADICSVGFEMELNTWDSTWKLIPIAFASSNRSEEHAHQSSPTIMLVDEV